MLLALLLGSFGRTAMAHVMVMPPADAAMAGHCHDEPAPSQQDRGKMPIDCMIACAVIAPAIGPAVHQVVPMPSGFALRAPPILSPFNQPADPPPPRCS